MGIFVNNDDKVPVINRNIYTHTHLKNIDVSFEDCEDRCKHISILEENKKDLVYHITNE